MAIKGTAEAVPLTDCACVKENRQRQIQKQIAFGNDKQEKQEQRQKAKAVGLVLCRPDNLCPIQIYMSGFQPSALVELLT